MFQFGYIPLLTKEGYPLLTKETSEVLSQHQLFGCQSNSQARAAELKAFAVKSFIVQRSIFPATKDNADPFERQCAYGGIMGFSALPLVVVVSPSPNRSEDGLTSELVKGLTQELRTSQAPVNPAGFATFLGDRSNTRELLHLGGEFESVAVGTESGQETRGQSGAGAGKAAKQRGIVMLGKQRGNLLVVAFNRFGQGRNLCDQRLNHHRRSQKDGSIFGQWLSLFNVAEQLLELVVSPVSLTLIKLADRTGSGSFQLLQRRPAVKKRARSRGMHVTEPVQRLGKVGLQSGRQLISQRCSFIDQMTPALGEQLNATGEDVIGNPDTQMLAMRQQDLQEQIGVAGIILGSAGIKRLAHLGQCLGIDRIDVKKLHMHQGIDQSSAYLLDGNSHGSATEANAHLMNPGLQRLGSLVQRKVFPSAIPPSLLQRDHVRLIGPIQSYKCGEFDILFRHQWITPLFPRLRTLPAGSAHNPYSGVLEGHHLSICPAPRADRVRKSPSTVDTVGWLIRNPTRPVFPEGNSLQKEKEPKRKKAAVLHMTDISHVKNYKGWLRGPRSASPIGRSLQKSPSSRGGYNGNHPPRPTGSAPLLT